MRLRLLTVLMILAAALAAVAAPAAWAQEDGGEPGAGQTMAEPEDPEPIPDFWTEEEPASGSGSGSGSSKQEQEQQRPSGDDAPRSSGETSTSPGGTAPGSGTATSGPGAQASIQDPEAGGAACDPPAMLRLALRSLRRAVAGRTLLDERARPVRVRIAPCMAGTYELAIVLSGGDTVLWRARRDLGSGIRRATLRLTLTGAGRRYIARVRRSGGGIVRMRLRARLYPAARP